MQAILLLYEICEVPFLSSNTSYRENCYLGLVYGKTQAGNDSCFRVRRLWTGTSYLP
jgi:hypothetical protein